MAADSEPSDSEPSELDIIAVNFDRQPYRTSRLREIYKGEFSPQYQQNRKECIMKINSRYAVRHIPFAPPSIEIYNIAKSRSEEFNIQKRGRSIVDFALTVIGRVERSSFPIPEVGQYQEVCVVEEFLGSEFQKWCSNYGYIAPDGNFLSGFAHWTWYESQGRSMLLDLQGVKEDDKYVLVDPVLLSNTVKGGVYGPTDVGVEGMAMFFAKHICGIACIKLPRPYIKKDFMITRDANVMKDILGKRTAYAVDMKLPEDDKQKLVDSFHEIACAALVEVGELRMAAANGPSELDIIAENFDSQPYSKSRYRDIFKGEFSPLYQLYRRECIMKIKNRCSVRDIRVVPPSLWTYDTAKSLSKKFNSQRRGHFIVDFAWTVIGKVERSSFPDFNRHQDVCVVEEFLGSEFQKWCSNYGYIAPDGNFLSGFAHWTWYESHGQSMLLDLQGVKEDDTYILVDPVLLSNTVKGGYYGPTDTGVEGMAMFFAEHDCGIPCIELPRPYIEKNFMITREAKVSKDVLCTRTAYTVDMVLPEDDRQKMVHSFPGIACTVLDKDSITPLLPHPVKKDLKER